MLNGGSFRMKICVVGAAGDIGRQIVSSIIRERIPLPDETLQLVGRDEPSSQLKLLGLISDLRDGFAETSPEIESAGARKVDADIIVIAAGSSTDSNNPKRAGLARANLPTLREYADGITFAGHEIVIIVTNPVELGVTVFCEKH